MRDGAIVEAFTRMERMVGSDIRLLNKTVATLAMRMDAIQKVMFGSRLAFIEAGFLSVFAPKMLERAIDRVHKSIEDDYKKKVEARMEEARKAVIKPEENTNPMAVDRLMKVVNVLIVFVGLSLVGCVPKSQIKRSYDEGFAKANTECLQLQGQIQNYIRGLEVSNAAKTERLRKFNQVDEQGNLYNKTEEEKKPGKK